MNKKIHKNLLLITCLVISLNHSYAQSHPFSGGDGSAEDPYQISNRSQLDSLRNRLGPGNSNIYYSIVNDIDLSGSSWVPIGCYLNGSDHSQAFCGKINGNNNIITGIEIGQENIPVTYKYTGLFGYLYEGAKIEDLHISGRIKACSFTTDFSYTGGLAGFIYCNSSINSIEIINCSNNTDITASNGSKHYVGGLAGYGYGKSISINNCTNYGNINVTSDSQVSAGGITGEMISPEISTPPVSNCSNHGNITIQGINPAIGGITGLSTGVGADGCENYGRITSTGPETNSIGGIIGEASVLSIRNCLNRGNVIGSGDYSMIGGICGTGKGNTASININGCVNLGFIYGGSGSYVSVGGIIGMAEVKVNITNSYNNSLVSCSGAHNRTGGIAGNLEIRGMMGIIEINNTYSNGIIMATGITTYTGGIAGLVASPNISVKNSVVASHFIFGSQYRTNRIIGENSSGFLTNNYANSDMTVIWNVVNSEENNSINGADIDLSRLFITGTYRNSLPQWDFDNVWQIRRDSSNMPYLQWQAPPVLVKGVSRYSVSLNTISALDSLKIYKYSFNADHIHLSTILDIPQGNVSYTANMQDLITGDTIAFYSFANGKKSSYPVLFVFNPHFANGQGTSGSPYEIRTRTELEYLHSFLGAQNNDKYYIIMDDIDLSGNPWVPVGSSLSNSFNGKIDGNGKKITGINIGNHHDTTYQYTGLFGFVSNGAIIENIHIDGGNIKGYSGYTGGIAGNVRNSSSSGTINIKNCTNSANISSRLSDGTYTGGIAGYIYGSDITVDNCINYGNISESYYLGGITGSAEAILNGTYITNSVNHGTISQGLYTGGIIGNGSGNGISLIIQKCVNYGNIISNTNNSNLGGIAGRISGNSSGYSMTLENSANFGLISAGNYNSMSIGGIAGKVENFTKIRNCYNRSDIIAYANVSNIGAITGSLVNNNNSFETEISNSYVYGTINSTGNNCKVGGIAGYVRSQILAVKNTFSVLEYINGKENSEVHRIAGMIEDNNPVVQNNYSGNETLVKGELVYEGITGASTIEGESKAPSQFNQNSIYSSSLIEWDFNNIWQIRNLNSNLPYFKWQSSPAHIHEIYRDSIKLNLYRASDEIIIYSTDNEQIRSVTNAPAGESILTSGLQEKIINDTVILINYEPLKWPSFPVLGKILPKTITISADPIVICFGEDEVELSYTVEPSLIPGDELTGELTRRAGTEPGVYQIMQGTLNNPNYIINYVGNTYTINSLPSVNEFMDIVACSGTYIDSIEMISPVSGTVFYWSGGDDIGLPDGNATGKIPGFTAVGDSLISVVITVEPKHTRYGLTCEGQGEEFTVTVNPNPSINHIEDQTVCSGTLIKEIKLNSFVEGTEFHWTGGSAIGLEDDYSETSIPSFIATSGELITVTIQVTPQVRNSGINCDGIIQEYRITVNPVPTVENIEDIEVCTGVELDSIPLNGSIEGTVYKWSGGFHIGLEDSQDTAQIPGFVAGSYEPWTSVITVESEFTYNDITCKGDTTEFSVIVAHPIVIVQQPSSVVYFCFNDEELQIPFFVKGSTDIFKWYKDDMELFTTDEARFLINNPVQSDEGIYYVEISGLCNSVTSTASDVRFREEPEGIVQQKWNNMMFVSDKNKEFLKEGYQWYKNGEPIPGATGQYYSVGNSENDMIDFDASYHVRIPLIYPENTFRYTCAVKFRKKETKISVFPNPVKKGDNFNILLPEYETGNVYYIELFNLVGQKLFETETGNDTITLPANLDPGTYIIKVHTGDMESSFKISVM